MNMEEDNFLNNDTKPEESIKYIEASNSKSSITCSNVPEGLFDTSAAKKHFSKFGRVHKIRLLPKKQMCVVEYEQANSVQRAVLNAGAYDGFMFNVMRTKARIRRKSKKEDDPDWVPDSDVEDELSAMGGVATYRVPRQKPMELDSPVKNVFPKTVIKPAKQILRKKFDAPANLKPKSAQSQPISGTQSPLIVSTQTSLNTHEAAAELHQLRSRISLTPDEKRKTLDARDRILRLWGGAGSRVKVGGATIGTCPDMCPEKELLHRQAEHQVMTLETIVDSDGVLEPWRAVKQYSRSSADQEMPMCYELRPPAVLMGTCAYLLHEVADTTRQVTLADWFHFMWDRLRSIRKDITQQALCCADSIKLVEMCARFHAHCAARLADLEHTQFDQKLNTDNLTKCLQTLKHMYSDVESQHKHMEAEFRGYIALLNLGDANFWWEIQQLPKEIQKSEPIIFAVKVFTALDNNNYVRFFRLVRDEATYLQACILLRYFNDVRARALARIVKAYAPRGGSKYPAEELMNSLAFETIESMKSFLNHYGLRFSKTDSELTVILDRNQFIEDSDPYPTARAYSLIESKRKNTVAEIIAGGDLPQVDYKNHQLHTSFNLDGKLTESSLIAEDLGYNTINDSNKDIRALKLELQRLVSGGKSSVDKINEGKKLSFVKPMVLPKFIDSEVSIPTNKTNGEKIFSFQPAVALDVQENTPEAIAADVKKQFTFSPPQESPFKTIDSKLFTSSIKQNLFNSKFAPSKTVFGNDNKTNAFKQSTAGSLFAQSSSKNVKDESQGISSKSLFANSANVNVFAKNVESGNNFSDQQNKNLFSKPSEANPNLFAKSSLSNDVTHPSSVFRTFAKPNQESNLFLNQVTSIDTKISNGETANLSPGTLFKQANVPFSSQDKPHSVFQSKDKTPTAASSLFSSVKTTRKNDVYEFDTDSNSQTSVELQQLERKKLEEARIEKELEEKKRKEIDKQMQQQKEEQRKEELRKLEEIRKKEEERKQEEVKKKLEEQRQAESKKKAEEEKIYKEKVEKEAHELIDELVNEVNIETVNSLMKDEMEKMKNLISYANTVEDEILTELLEETCNIELNAEIFWTKKLMKKWFYVWRKQIMRNLKRRQMLDDTPVWITDKTPLEEAQSLRRLSEKIELKHMNAINRGYKFHGKLSEIPLPQPYNLVEIIRSPFLKRMKEINYPYDKCFFWKLTLVSPGTSKWLCKKINIETWLLHVFRDKEKDAVENLIHVGKQSWNKLMNFATSVTLINYEKPQITKEALVGTNGVIFYMCHDFNIESIVKTLEQKNTYHIVPIAIITTPISDTAIENDIQIKLTQCVKNEVISDFRIYVVEPTNVASSLDNSTKRALKWLAKRCPKPPPLEIDTLKSICQKILGNEIWHWLKTDQNLRTKSIMKDIQKLVKYYNTAVDKLTEVITNENVFNYPTFPAELTKFLDYYSPNPKPYEFIPNCLKSTENTTAIKKIMQSLKLRNPLTPITPSSVLNMQEQVRKYCHQIGWFKNPEKVVCKVVSQLPSEFPDNNVPSDDFVRFFEQYNLTEIVTIIIYEKITMLNFDKQFAIYLKDQMDDYLSANWLYEIDVISSMKHKADDSDDIIDYFIEAKRRKLDESYECLALEEKDCTMVQDTISSVDRSISKCDSCKKVVSDLEMKLKEEKKKSEELENILRAALNDI